MNIDDNINALDEVHKGCCMALDAINFILEKTESREFKKVLKDEKTKYDKSKKNLEEEYNKISNEKPHSTNIIDKTMTLYGIEMKTIGDESTSHFSELLLKGTNMGIIEGRKILNNKDLNSKIKSIIEKFVQMQESSVEIYKKYL